MIQWGISANSHDAALAVFNDQDLVFASHSERFSGIKNDKHLCQELVDYARQWGEPENIYWYENPYLKTVRQLYAGQGWKWKDNNIQKYLRQWNINAPIRYSSHHRSHAAFGYFTSPFDYATIVVIDAIGEFETLTIWRACGDELTKIHSISFPNSIGLWYSAMTQRCHLKPLEDEYILMGMAAYGDPGKLTDTIVNDFFKFPDGEIVRSKKNLHRGCMDWRPDLIVNDTFDIAAGTQRAYEYLLRQVLEYALGNSFLCGLGSNLVFVGGCALNCSANRILGEFFDNIWIPPNPGDAGSAVGAVLAKNKWRIELSPYLGYDIKQSANNTEIVDYLIENKICGLARGRAEFGPRALGNRSLLADPRDVNIKERVNDIKQRQQFRPFAPAILEEVLPSFFDMPPGWDRSRYMQVVGHCRYPHLFPGIVHRDATSRVQSVPQDGSPFRRLLEEWYDRTGCPMLLNTSLNIKGQPMVNNEADARAFEAQYAVKVFS